MIVNEVTLQLAMMNYLIKNKISLQLHILQSLDLVTAIIFEKRCCDNLSYLVLNENLKTCFENSSNR